MRPAVSLEVSTAALCEGWVSHRRLRPRHHLFVQKIFFLRVPVSRFREIANPVLSVRGFNLLSFRVEDYGPRDGSDPRRWVDAVLALGGLPPADGEIVLQTFPRMLGYVFNPVSFWFVYTPSEALRAVICEVNNTFGERHNYLVAHADGRPIGARDTLSARKLLHVSPFCKVRGRYDFRFGYRAGQWTATIDYHDGTGEDDRLILTSVNGRPRPLTARACLSAFLRYPLFTLGVIARIHWHALRLWLKRVPWYRKPPAPQSETSIGSLP